jgi:transposase-like protein
MARPTLFTAARAALIIRTIRETGCSLGAAARVAGIGESTLRDWRKRGADELSQSEDPAEPMPERAPESFGEFVVALEQALAGIESMLTKCLVDAAAKDWRAAAWWLERRRPETYGANPTADDKAPEPRVEYRFIDAKAASDELCRRLAVQRAAELQARNEGHREQGA